MSEQLTFEFKERSTIKGFPELRWTGKRPYRSTQYYPAQLRERYGEERDGWINRIYWGDNLQVMSHLLKEFRGQVDLIYIDPPFDSKAEYKKTVKLRAGKEAISDVSAFEEKQYGDIWTNDEYLQFMYERLIIMRELLSDTGSIFLHCDPKKNYHLRCLLDEIFGKDRFVNEIVWSYRRWTGSAKNFLEMHDTIYFYSKTDKYKFNTMWTAYTDASLNRKKNFHTRIKGDDIFETSINKNGVKDNDVWNISVINSQALERTGYPTQKPEALIEKITKAVTDPGDLVFDCFMGSGTTQAVAMKLGRRFIGADINLGAIQTTTKRLISLAADLSPVTPEPLQLTVLKGDKASDGINDNNITSAAEDSNNYLVAAGTEDDEGEGEELIATEAIPFTGFEVYNVNNYEFFRNPVEARDLLIEALEIQPFPQSDIWDGELDGRMVKIMPVNRIATKADLEELKANLPYKTYEKRKEESPRQPVEKITLICMGHEPDLKASLEAELSEYKLDIEIVDILRDKADLQLKRDSEADIAIEGGRLVIRAFYPLNLMQKLSLQKEFVEDWRQLVESVMIDWNYDGAVMQPSVMDVPGKKEMVKGIYDIPEGAGTIKVKITDLLSESLEVEVR
jgi:site-specific DNA-methyltransferase (adenine-specific)